MSLSKLTTKNILFGNNPIILLIILYLILIQFCFALKLNNRQRFVNNSPINHKINIRSEEQNKLNYNSDNNGLFRQYISGGLFNCGTKYVEMLQKLNKFIEHVHEEFSTCKKQMNQINKTQFSEQFQIIDDLFGNDEINEEKENQKEEN
ncbi:hypothetical protein ACQ4LE_010027 [Meloidogyne hapla]|uniref:Transmembrane protein n=1 Tax=Meloidogyne hapla TaxID=6305 RepID=A0A1I8BIS2_MELHA